MSAHTPGPWWPHKNSAGGWDVMTLRAEYPDMPIGDGCGAFIASAYADKTDSRTRGKEEANARLIAAAPDLLTALQAVPADADFAHAADHRAALERWWSAVAAPAIAKATGAQP